MNKKSSEEFFKPERKVIKFSIKKIVIFFLLILVIIIPIIKLHIVAKKRIEYIAFNQIGNDSNQTLLIDKILKWEGDNIIDINMKENENYPCIRIPDGFNYAFQPYYLISITRCGRCGEFAGMFSQLANEFNIKNRVITASHIDGNNHAWAEVLVDGKWVPIETSDLYGYNSTRFYDKYNASKFYNCSFMIKYKNIITQDGKDVSKNYYSWCF